MGEGAGVGVLGWGRCRYAWVRGRVNAGHERALGVGCFASQCPSEGGTRQCWVPGQGRKEPREKLWPKARKEKPWMLFYADGVHCAERQRCKHDHTDGQEEDGRQEF